MLTTQNIHFFPEKHIGENIILIPIFWGHNQFGPYILVTANLVPIIFKF